MFAPPPQQVRRSDKLRFLFHVFHALCSVCCLSPLHSRCVHIAKKRQSLIRKSKSTQNPDLPREQRLEVSRNNALLYTIDGYVAAGNTHAVQGYVRSKLIMRMTKLSPHSAPCLALLLYVINEGYILSLITRVQLESMPIVHFPKPRQDVYRSLKEVFAEALLGN